MFQQICSDSEAVVRAPFDCCEMHGAARFVAVSDGEKVLLIETNFYGAGGSKLKSVAGEFSQLATVVSTNEVSFAWITDGKGWSTALKPLREAYEKVDHVLNLSMLSEGFVESFFRSNRI